MSRHFSDFHFNNAQRIRKHLPVDVFRRMQGEASAVQRGRQRSALFPAEHKEARLFGRLHVLAIGINSPYAHASSVQTNSLRSREHRRANVAVPRRTPACFRL